MEQESLFYDHNYDAPLAERMRPKTLDEFVGQTSLLGEGRVLRKLIDEDKVSSMIFWGPPGVGKTTLAKIIANKTKSTFINFSAVTSGIKDIKTVMEEADKNKRYGNRTILFVDEIHRFNKAQQDAFLPYVERGSIVLIGATTENPSFEVNNALLSRCKVFVLNSLTIDDIVSLLKRAISSPEGFGNENIKFDESILRDIAVFSNGDARNALSTLEMLVLNSDKQGDSIVLKREMLEQITSKKTFLYDRNGEEHYNIISALHKSMRNSDPDAAIYWLARMLEAGEDPLYIARRCIRFASEDVGMADPKALEIAVAGYQACHFIGMPECNVNLTEVVTYLSLAPKSNAMEVSYDMAAMDAKKMLDEPVPMNIRNAPTSLMEELGYGKGYIYAHDTKEKVAAMQCLPDSLKDREYYKPGTQGLEIKYGERLKSIKDWKRNQLNKKEEQK